MTLSASRIWRPSPAAAIMLAALLGWAPFALRADPTPSGAESGRFQVSLITILPGPSLYSAFGHTGLRVVDAASDRDLFYNYGLSARDFDLGFALGMFAGRMEFMVGAGRTADVLGFYSGVENRTIFEQVLDLDEAQGSSLVETLRRDIRPENRIYNYRYFSDNCTTRVAAMLQALANEDGGGGGGGVDGKPETPSGTAVPRMTVRASIKGVLGERDWLVFVVDMLMGPNVDRKPTAGDAIFLPEQLMDWAEAATVEGRSLVRATRTVYEAEPSSAAFSVPPAIAAAILLGLSVVVALLRRRRLAAAFDSLLFGFALIVGLGVALFWLLAGYEEAAWNVNLLWANAAPAIALAAGAKASRRGAAAWLFRAAAVAAGLVAALGGLGVQSVGPEARLLACAIMVRCADRGFRRGAPRGAASAT
ncbi:MAG: DUF4105 domain-containing protein [Spirochaetes bacterium]|nr:DUF4105 domain-containing protein [Spirochaetota bacterium]MBU1080297.1 DUF4105 domain-containing protein [Spirochaetota bacterium]